MRVTATAKYIRMSPRKLRLVTDLITGNKPDFDLTNKDDANQDTTNSGSGSIDKRSALPPGDEEQASLCGWPLPKKNLHPAPTRPRNWLDE